MATPPPELREDRGEIEAATDGSLPGLVEEGDTRGDLHCHTADSDGSATVAEMVAAAEARGYEYLAVTDHATGPGMVGGVGLDDEELESQIVRIREADDDADVAVFAGVEANVDADGDLSVDDALLEELDVVVASPHSGLDGDGTGRLVAAAEHPATDVVGHPGGRLLNRRSGLDLEVRDLAAAAAGAGTALEINADPRRLDLHGAAVQVALEEGATVSIGTDAHHPGGFDHVRYGVHTARRGWAEPADVLTTWSLEDVRDFIDL